MSALLLPPIQATTANISSMSVTDATPLPDRTTTYHPPPGNNLPHSDFGYPFALSSSSSSSSSFSSSFSSSLFSDSSLSPNSSTSTNFFDTYYSQARFTVETVLACTSAILNIIAVSLILGLGCCCCCGCDPRRRKKKNKRISLYNILFVNLSVANALSSLLFLVSNNILFFLARHLGSLFSANPCLFYVHILAAVFLSASFSLVNVVTLLAFAVLQYLAVCRPLAQQLRGPSRRNTYTFVAACWATSAVVGLVPYSVGFPYVRQRPCVHDHIRAMIGVSDGVTNASTIVTGVIYVTVVTVSARIYVSIRAGQRSTSHLRADHLRREERAFFTIIFLLTTMTMFVVPYLVLHLLSLNFFDDRFLNHPFVIYYMNMLPYLKYMSDPVIYGLRMRELRGAWRVVLIGCGSTPWTNRSRRGSVTLHDLANTRSFRDYVTN